MKDSGKSSNMYDKNALKHDKPIEEKSVPEKTLYSDPDVNVTTTRIIISGTTNDPGSYALRNITSVRMAMTQPKNGCATLLLILSIMSLIGSLGVSKFRVESAIFHILIIILAIVWYRSCKPTYHLAISSASGEQNALSSQDREHVKKIVESINEAIDILEDKREV